MNVWPRFAWLGKPQRCWPAFLACPGVSGGEVLHHSHGNGLTKHHHVCEPATITCSREKVISSNIRGAGASTSSYCLRHHTPSGTWRINGTGHAKSSPWYELLTRQLKKGGGIEAYVGPFNPALRL